MPLSPDQAVEQARILHEFHTSERLVLDEVRRYFKGRQALPAVIPSGSPSEVTVMARSSRVNVLELIVNSLVQSAFVDGFRGKGDSSDLDVWDVWQRNRMDARQTGIHRAAAAYGTSYAIVLPGTLGRESVPVIRGASPRSLTAVYGEDPDWPMWALERCDNGLWKLYDDEAVYYLSLSDDRSLDDGKRKAEFITYAEHGMGVCPVVRYLDEDDLDADDEVDRVSATQNDLDLPSRGQVVPQMPTQDQIDLTTFSLQIAQHYGAFRQRYIIGWVPATEADRVKSSASTLLAIDRDPEDVKVGEFNQSDLSGLIESREASLRHAATLSQTPVHELTGQLVNLSAEALAAAEAGKDRKVNERQTLWGESHEQTLWLVGQLTGSEVPDDSQVVWRDTSARSFAATVDALGKLATMLKIPEEELWERVPDTTQQDVERYRKAKQEAERGGTPADIGELTLSAQRLGLAIQNGVLSDEEARKLIGLQGPNPSPPVPRPAPGF